MKWERCDKGHLYDEEKFEGCPKCHPGIVSESAVSSQIYIVLFYFLVIY